MGPTLATAKRLFAVSGNNCAFPKCTQPLVHDGKLTGRVCHIKAANSGGPRYARKQTDVERHAFDNLVLMCPIHHDVIDADVVAYTVDRLAQIKSEHEAKHTGGTEADDQVARQLIVDLSGATATDGSIIVTHNQMGGQVAHEIHNYGPPKRVITPVTRARMFEILRQAQPRQIGFASTQGDVEAHEFKQQLIDVFREAGWHTQDMRTFMFFGTKTGIVLTIPFDASEAGLLQVVAHALAQTGNPVAWNRGDMANTCGMYVQVWNAP